MFKKLVAMPQIAVCSAIVGTMVFGLTGCAKKEAEQANTTPAQEVAATPVETPSVAGMYSAQVGAEGGAQTIMLMLNADNTATISVQYAGGQPAMTQNGTWAMGETADIVNFMYGAEATMMTMPLTVVAGNLHMIGEMAGGDEAGITLVKQGVAEADTAGADPHAGHNH